jgi:hypothetical protein
MSKLTFLRGRDCLGGALIPDLLVCAVAPVTCERRNGCAARDLKRHVKAGSSWRGNRWTHLKAEWVLSTN